MIPFIEFSFLIFFFCKFLSHLYFDLVWSDGCLVDICADVISRQQCGSSSTKPKNTKDSAYQGSTYYVESGLLIHMNNIVGYVYFSLIQQLSLVKLLVANRQDTHLYISKKSQMWMFSQDVWFKFNGNVKWDCACTRYISPTHVALRTFHVTRKARHSSTVLPYLTTTNFSHEDGRCEARISISFSSSNNNIINLFCASSPLSIFYIYLYSFPFLLHCFALLPK